MAKHLWPQTALPSSTSISPGLQTAVQHEALSCLALRCCNCCAPVRSQSWGPKLPIGWHAKMRERLKGSPKSERAESEQHQVVLSTELSRLDNAQSIRYSLLLLGDPQINKRRQITVSHLKLTPPSRVMPRIAQVKVQACHNLNNNPLWSVVLRPVPEG